MVKATIALQHGDDAMGHLRKVVNLKVDLQDQAFFSFFRVERFAVAAELSFTEKLG